MSLDFVAVFTAIREELSARRPLADSMTRVIDCCAASQPHSDWQQLRELPFHQMDSLQQWIREPFQQEPPEEEIAGLWFGLFNPVVNGEAIADLYVCGTSAFDPNDHSFDWACDPAWWPESRYAGSEVLAEISRIAYQQDGLKNDAEYPLSMAYAALAARELLTPPPEVIQPWIGVGVGVGYDNGDGIILGRVSAEGLEETSG